MISAIERTVAAALLLILPLRAFNDATFVVTATLANGTYCSAPNGNTTLWIHIDVKYGNSLGVPMILSMATRVAEYQLFPNDAKGHLSGPLREFKSKSSAMFDASRLDRLPPDPQLFEMLQPGGVAHRIEKIGLAVRGPKVNRLPEGDYYLRVRVEQWPAERRWGEALARSWGTRGKLLIDSVTLPPIGIHIQQEPTNEPCPVRVD
jgi:hypothetical protein